jgi:UPF0755 protein
VRSLRYLSIAFVLVCSVYLGLPIWSRLPTELTAAARVTLAKGQGLSTLAENLKSKGVIQSSRFFTLYVRCFFDYKTFKAATYYFEQGLVTPQELVARLVEGDTRDPVVFSYTVPEGLTYKQLAQKLALTGEYSMAELMSLFTDATFRQVYKIMGPHIEGFTFPATYRFYGEKPTARAVIEASLQEFYKQLPSDYPLRLKGIDLYQAVVFASLIEKETTLDEERRLIAEVIWLRLQQGNPLGIDASLIYGIKDYQGSITTMHLKDRSNPYNGRIHKGLPPTPIAAPSLASLLAVLQPTDKGYFFYVLTDPGGKAHTFSKTLDEHNRHVRSLVKKQRALHLSRQ